MSSRLRRVAGELDTRNENAAQLKQKEPQEAALAV